MTRRDVGTLLFVAGLAVAAWPFFPGRSVSLIGDTTTTMMWIDGVAASSFVPWVAAGLVLMTAGFFVARRPKPPEGPG
jgi:hypothetical protein